MTVPEIGAPPRICPPEGCTVVRMLAEALPNGVNIEAELGAVIPTKPDCAHFAQSTMAKTLEKPLAVRPNTKCGMNSFDQADARNLAAQAIAEAASANNTA